MLDDHIHAGADMAEYKEAALYHKELVDITLRLHIHNTILQNLSSSKADSDLYDKAVHNDVDHKSKYGCKEEDMDDLFQYNMAGCTCAWHSYAF